MTKLEFGAVAVIDALGFKGIWRGSNGETDVSPLTTLRNSRAKVNGIMSKYARKALIPRRHADLFAAFGSTPKLGAAFFSDSIIITATVKPSAKPASKDCEARVGSILLEITCLGAAYAMREAAQCEPPLVYRGAVAIGPLRASGPFVISPAIDEAAENAEKAEGAFVWLTPSTIGVERPVNQGPPNHWALMGHDYPVPMKGGARFRTIAISPFVDNADGHARAKIRAGIEVAMTRSRGLDVMIKRQNTSNSWTIAIRSTSRSILRCATTSPSFGHHASPGFVMVTSGRLHGTRGDRRALTILIGHA